MGAAKKVEPEVERPSVRITNLQKVGALRYFAAKNDPTVVVQMVSIPAGETGEVPAGIWDRYKDREDVLAADGVRIVIGGLKPGQEMKTPNAQEIANSMAMKEITKARKELDEYAAVLENKRAELEARASEVG